MARALQPHILQWLASRREASPACHAHFGTASSLPPPVALCLERRPESLPPCQVAAPFFLETTPLLPTRIGATPSRAMTWRRDDYPKNTAYAARRVAKPMTSATRVAAERFRDATPGGSQYATSSMIGE